MYSQLRECSILKREHSLSTIFTYKAVCSVGLADMKIVNCSMKTYVFAFLKNMMVRRKTKNTQIQSNNLGIT